MTDGGCRDNRCGRCRVCIASPPIAAADSQQDPAGQRSCVSSVTSTKCVKPGDAEINSAIPGPVSGVFGIYGPFCAGG
jgi:hypothetical protein